MGERRALESREKRGKPLVERAGGAVFWNTAFFPLKLLISLVSGIVVVRLLRTEGFGLYITATALLNTLGLFSDLGIERALPRFYPEVEMRYGQRGIARLFAWVIAVKGIILLVLVSALLLFPDFWINLFDLGASGWWLLLIVCALLVLGAASDVSIQFLYAHFKQKMTNLLNVLTAIVGPVLTALFVYLGWGAIGAMSALLITTILSVMITLVLAWRLFKSIPPVSRQNALKVKLPSNRPLRERLFSFAGLNYLINWSVYLYDRDFIVFVLGFLLADEKSRVEIAVVGLAYKLTKEFLRALVAPLNGVQTPLFARLYAEHRMDGLKTAYATITKFLILTLVPAGIGLILVARNVLDILYVQVGPDAVLTAVKLPVAIACTILLAVGLFGEAAISVALNVLMVFENYRAVLVARLFALVGIPLMLLLVPEHGAVGAAAAAAIAGLLSRSAALIYGVMRHGLPFPAAFFVRVMTASLAMGFALLPLLALFPPEPPITAFMIGLGALVFWGAFKLLGGMDLADKERFRSLNIPFANVALRFL